MADGSPSPALTRARAASLPEPAPAPAPATPAAAAAAPAGFASPVESFEDGDFSSLTPMGSAPPGSLPYGFTGTPSDHAPSPVVTSPTSVQVAAQSNASVQFVTFLKHAMPPLPAQVTGPILLDFHGDFLGAIADFGPKLLPPGQGYRQRRFQSILPLGSDIRNMYSDILAVRKRGGQPDDFAATMAELHAHFTPANAAAVASFRFAELAGQQDQETVLVFISRFQAALATFTRTTQTPLPERYLVGKFTALLRATALKETILNKAPPTLREAFAVATSTATARASAGAASSAQRRARGGGVARPSVSAHAVAAQPAPPTLAATRPSALSLRPVLELIQGGLPVPKLTPALKEQLRTAGGCFRCRVIPADHTAQSCPLGPTIEAHFARRRAQGSSPAGN